jgi:hypothetical protein
MIFSEGASGNEVRWKSKEEVEEVEISVFVH